MLRLVLLPVLIVTFLLAAVNDTEVLKRADKLVRSGEKTEVFRAYNDYKNIYLRSMMNDDSRMRQKALKGIVKTGNILRIDVARYENELKTFKPASKSVKKSSATNDARQSLEQIRWRDGRLVLSFDRNLRKHEVNYFKLFDKAKKRYRYIFDVDAVMTQPKESLRHSKVKRISLAQFNSKKLRLVIENDKALPLRFKRDKKSLVINLGVGASKVAKTVKPKKPVSVAKRLHLKNVHWRKGDMVLQFDQKLPSKYVKFSKLQDKKSKRYRYIFDINKAMFDKDHKLRHDKIKRIKLAQFDSKTLRLVIEDDAKLKVSHRVKGGELIINLGLKKSDAPKSTEPVYKAATFDKVIVLDPGHGGRDAGAVGYKKYREKVVVFNIAKELSKLLKKQGYKVYMTRTGDKFVKLQKRTRFANKKKADLFISIHANAVPKRNAKKAYGIETYFLSNDHRAGSERAKRVAAMENSKDLKDVTFYGKQDFINILNREKIKMSERLAFDLQRNILAVLRKSYSKVKDGGVREGPFWILVGAQMPAVLVEVGFITHPTEAQRMVKRAYQKRFAEGLANGINQYFINNP
jgi:N-acetylmuramoyl-L-alanine amidase